MIRYKKIIMTLALLLTAVTGAWAEEKIVTINSSTMSSGAVTATGFSTLLDNLYVNFNTATITTSEGVITKLVIKKGDIYVDAFTEANVGVTPGTITYGSDEITVTDINAESVTLSRKGGQNWSPSSVDVYYDAPAEWPLTSKDGKNWILDKMPANNIELQVEYEPTKVTMAANDKTMGTVEVSGESKVEWTADTWAGWTYSTKEYTVDDITMTSTQTAYIQEITEAGDYLHSLNFYVSQEDNNSTVTFSTTGDPFSRIEFTMINDYDDDHLVSNRWVGNPVIMPKDNWTFEGKSAVWEGEATKSLTLQSCTTTVSKITFFKGAVPDGVTVNGDGTFTVAKTATVTLTATPAEGYKFLYWEDDPTNTNPVREVTIESGMADMTYKAVFAEPTYTVEFADGTEESDKWSASPNTDVKKGQTVTVTYSGTKKVIGVKAEKKAVVEGHALSASAVGEIVGSDGKAYVVADKDNLPSGVTAVAMVAYKSGSNGLAIQLNASPVEKNWADAKTYAEGLTAVPGGTWRLPSKVDWQNMFVGCAVSGDASAGDNMSPIAGFKAKIAATGITWQSADYWSSTESGSYAWIVGVNLNGSNARAEFNEFTTSIQIPILGCLAF